MIRDTLREVYACQKDNGGFSLWSDSAFDSPYVSAYAVFALLKAYEAGVPIDKSRLESGLDYLRTILRTKFDPAAYPYERRGWATVQAFALYDLALAGRPEAAYAEKLFQERERPSALRPGAPAQGLQPVRSRSRRRKTRWSGNFSIRSRSPRPTPISRKTTRPA